MIYVAFAKKFLFGDSPIEHSADVRKEDASQEKKSVSSKCTTLCWRVCLYYYILTRSFYENPPKKRNKTAVEDDTPKGFLRLIKRKSRKELIAEGKVDVQKRNTPKIQPGESLQEFRRYHRLICGSNLDVLTRKYRSGWEEWIESSDPRRRNRKPQLPMKRRRLKKRNGMLL